MPFPYKRGNGRRDGHRQRRVAVKSFSFRFGIFSTLHRSIIEQEFINQRLTGEQNRRNHIGVTELVLARSAVKLSKIYEL